MQEAQIAQPETHVTEHPLLTHMRWSKGREPEARAIMRQGGRTTLLSQIAGECGAVLLDRTVTKSVLRGGLLISKGERVTRGFKVYKGTLDVVIARFMLTGWVPAKTQGLLELTVLPEPTEAGRDAA
jgi:hypothetical protein